MTWYYNYCWFIVPCFNYVLMELKIIHSFVLPRIDTKLTAYILSRSSWLHFLRVSWHTRFLLVLCDFISVPNLMKTCISRLEVPNSSSVIFGYKLLKSEDLMWLTFMHPPGLIQEYSHIIHCVREIFVGHDCLFCVVTDLNISTSSF